MFILVVKKLEVLKRKRGDKSKFFFVLSYYVVYDSTLVYLIIGSGIRSKVNVYECKVRGISWVVGFLVIK